MAADLHLHIFEGITEEDLRMFNYNTLGSKYFAGIFAQISDDKRDRVLEKIMRTPDIWIGEVSWLKAILSGDRDTFVPSVVGGVSDIIGENLPIIDDELIQKILKTFDTESKNTITSYSVAKKEDVEKFLIKHKGKKVFTVSW